MLTGLYPLHWWLIVLHHCKLEATSCWWLKETESGTWLIGRRTHHLPLSYKVSCSRTSISLTHRGTQRINHRFTVLTWFKEGKYEAGLVCIFFSLFYFIFYIFIAITQSTSPFKNNKTSQISSISNVSLSSLWLVFIVLWYFFYKSS